MSCLGTPRQTCRKIATGSEQAGARWAQGRRPGACLQPAHITRHMVMHGSVHDRGAKGASFSAGVVQHTLHQQASCSKTPGQHGKTKLMWSQAACSDCGPVASTLAQVVHVQGPGCKPQACTLDVRVAALQLTCIGHVCVHRQLGRLDSSCQGVIQGLDVLLVAGDHHTHTEGVAHLPAGRQTETQAMPHAFVPEIEQAQAQCATRTLGPAAG